MTFFFESNVNPSQIFKGSTVVPFWSMNMHWKIFRSECKHGTPKAADCCPNNMEHHRKRRAGPSLAKGNHWLTSLERKLRFPVGGSAARDLKKRENGEWMRLAVERSRDQATFPSNQSNFPLWNVARRIQWHHWKLREKSRKKYSCIKRKGSWLLPLDTTVRIT